MRNICSSFMTEPQSSLLMLVTSGQVIEESSRALASNLVIVFEQNYLDVGFLTVDGGGTALD